VTPRAMTINPVNTRLIRASALELRSKICAMNESRFDLRCGCAACAGGHIVHVQEMLNDRTSGSGRGRPKFQYSSRRPLRTKRRVPHREKVLWESDLQSLEKKIVCDKRDFGETTTVLLAPCVPEVGMFKKKISCQNLFLASAFNSPGPRYIPRLCTTRRSTGRTTPNRLRRRRCPATTSASQ